MHSPVKIDTADGVTILTLNRPERRNALDQAMYAALGHAIASAGADESTRVLLLTGAGGYFTAGNDLADFAHFRKGGEFAALTFLKTIAACPKPVVAAVERGAIGIGTTMLQHCDFVYAGRSTRFHLPFIQFALCVEGGASLLLARGPLARQVTRWLMLGDPFGADEALAAGLLTAICDDDQALVAANEVASRLARMSPDAMHATKALLQRARGPVAETLVEEVDAFTTLLERDEAQAALRDFIERFRQKEPKR